MKIGYVRAGAEDRSMARQIERLTREGIEPKMIYQDQETNVRSGLKRMLAEINPGDCLYVTDFSRLTRSLTQLLLLFETLWEKEVELISLSENWFAIRKNDPVSQLRVGLIEALNRFSRNNVSKAAREGKIARNRGLNPGRPRGMDPQKIMLVRMAQELIVAGTGITEACRSVGVTRATFHRYRKQMEKERESYL